MKTGKSKSKNITILSDYPDLPPRSQWRDLALDAKILGFVVLLAGFFWSVTYFFDSS